MFGVTEHFTGRSWALLKENLVKLWNRVS